MSAAGNDGSTDTGGAEDRAPRFEGALDSHSPSAMGLARLSHRAWIAPGTEDLYKQLILLVELKEGEEFVCVPCGLGVTAQFLVGMTGAAGSGVDPDEELIEIATQRAKEADLAQKLHYEVAPLADLPYQDEVFDVAFAELDLAAAADPAAAVRELARVTRPMGTVVLVAPVWTTRLEASRRQELVERLGIQPALLVEWKQRLRDAGVVDLHVEDWSDAAVSASQPSALGGLTELFSFRGKLELLPQAWRRWGWDGVRNVFAQEREIRRLVMDEGVLGVSVIKGTRWTSQPDGTE